MLCPKCGKEIADGSLFCTYCFADISVVETYDGAVEQAVNEAMEDVTKHVTRVTTREKARTERSNEVERQKKRMNLMVIGIIAGVVVASIILLIYEVMASRTESHYVAQAYEKAAEGDYSGAAADIEHALSLRDTTRGDMELLLTKSEYEMKAGDTDDALDTLQEMLGSAMDSSETLSAWSRIIEIYSARGDYATIAGMLRSCGDEEVQSTYRRYMIYDPRFDTPSGNYNKELRLTITADGDGSIFYTLDGSRPTTNSNLYTEPILLRTGMTRVNAIYVNHFGVATRTLSRIYWISKDGIGVKEPQRMDPNAPAPNDQDPDPADSEDPENPEDSEDPKDRKDQEDDKAKQDQPEETDEAKEPAQDAAPATTDNYTDADGPGLIIQALIGLGEPMTADGTVENGQARFVYGWQGRQNIGGVDYYTYAEMMQDAAGNSVYTGRQFAVNTTTGSVGYIDGGGVAAIH